jgi:hypothetical protein
MHQRRRGGEGYRESLLAGGKAKRQRDMGLAGARVAERGLVRRHFLFRLRVWAASPKTEIV